MEDLSGAIEEAAWATSIVRSVVLNDDGKRRKHWPYLAFRALERPSGRYEFQRLKDYIQKSSPDQVDHDIGRLLQSVNWRVHGIAAVALLVAPSHSEILLARLWKRMQVGSAVAPALCAAASMVDPHFVEKGLELLAAVECFPSSTVAVHALLQSTGASFVYTDHALANIALASREDERLEKRSGQGALYWREDASRCLAAA
jgi:hypothetical protein